MTMRNKYVRRSHISENTNNGHGFAVNNSGRNKMKFESDIVNDDGVAGVVTSVKTNHVVGFTSKEISDFSFAFIAPLGTYDGGNVRFF